MAESKLPLNSFMHPKCGLCTLLTIEDSRCWNGINYQTKTWLSKLVVQVTYWCTAKSGKKYLRRTFFRLSQLEEYPRNITYKSLKSLPKMYYGKKLWDLYSPEEIEFDPENLHTFQVQGILPQPDTFQWAALDKGERPGREAHRDFESGLWDRKAQFSEQRLSGEQLTFTSDLNVWEEQLSIKGRLFSPEEIDKFNEAFAQRCRIDTFLLKLAESCRTGHYYDGWHGEVYEVRAEKISKPIVTYYGKKKFSRTPTGKLTVERTYTLEKQVEIPVRTYTAWARVDIEAVKEIITQAWKATWGTMLKAARSGERYFPEINRHYLRMGFKVIAEHYGIELPIKDNKPKTAWELEDLLEQSRDKQTKVVEWVRQAKEAEKPIPWDKVIETLDKEEARENELFYKAHEAWTFQDNLSE
jgi:hypothetical protein